MKLMKCLSAAADLGTKVVDLWSKGTDTVDRLIHRKEYEKEKKQAVVYRVMLIVACSGLGLLILPYRIIVRKDNGYIYIKSTLLTLTNETEEEKAERLSKEHGTRTSDDGDGFEICSVVDEDPAIEIVAATEAEDAE